MEQADFELILQPLSASKVIWVSPFNWTNNFYRNRRNFIQHSLLCQI